MKKFYFFAAVCLSAIVFCCKISQPVNQPDENFSESSLNGNDVFVHEGKTVFLLKDIHLSENALSGKYDIASNTKNNFETDDAINIYVNEPTLPSVKSAEEKITITRKQIRQVIFPGTLHPKKAKTDDDDTGIAIGLLILLIIGSI